MECTHDKRFGGVFFAKNGCVACQLEEECRARKAVDFRSVAEKAVRRALERIGSIWWKLHERTLIEALEEAMALSDDPRATSDYLERWENRSLLAEMRRIRAAVEAEREQCARLAACTEDSPSGVPLNQHIAAAIRARGA